jgi:hypothetical protein
MVVATTARGGRADQEQPMDPTERTQLEALMHRLADGDGGAVVELIDAYGDRLHGVVARHLHELHRADVLRDRDEVDGLVVDAALAIADRAGGWSADGGAAPWTWADRAIRAEVVSYLGHPSVDVEIDVLDLAAARDRHPSSRASGAGAADFHRLADHDPRVAQLRAAIARAATNSRDAEVHVEYQLQKRSGDPSPAHTVAALYDLTAANVRQIDCSVRRRLVAVVDDDPALAPLTELAWLDPSGSAAGRTVDELNASAA